MSHEKTPESGSNFLRDLVKKDLETGRWDHVVTRFPPEPNGYLHIGHAKAIWINFSIAKEFGGRCNLRMDDTNPTREESEYVRAIVEDVRWLIQGWAEEQFTLKPIGAKPERREVDGRVDFLIHPASKGEEAVEPFFASDYFEALYEFALQLIRKGKAYVCDLSPEEVDAYRGAPDRPGKESPYRNRSIEENLDLFQRMRAGEFPDGSKTLRAKIDMASPNVWMRDPVLYRIRHTEHHHAGKGWCIYPTYDFAHCLSDYIEGITHSFCTMEFEVHRPLYDWILEQLDLPRPRPHQYEFARLNLTYTVLSKRRLLQLVREGHVKGWDDPRMPTLSGLRRRGVPPEAIRRFCETIGVTRHEGVTDVALLEHAIRDVLNRIALRRMAVLRPIKVVITNLPEDHYEELPAVNNPEDPAAGTRLVPFTRELWIEQDDFMEEPPPKYYRLKPGGEVRLKYAYIIRCDEVVKDEEGRILELRCTADLGSKRGGPTAGRKVKGTIHWVSARHAVDAEVRLYDRLFRVPEPEAEEENFLNALNPNSLQVVTAKVEPSLREVPSGTYLQFERLGYFYPDVESRPDRLIFNRTITLRDTWGKILQKSREG